MPKDNQVVATNRRARHDYEVLETYEAGLALQGSEVKSLRTSKVQLSDSYAHVTGGEAFLKGVHIAPYSFSAASTGHEPERERKLLLHREEIDELRERLERERLTLVPLSLYFKQGRAKVELGLARGRKRYDKRHALAAKDADREAERAVADARRRHR